MYIFGSETGRLRAAMLAASLSYLHTEEAEPCWAWAGSGCC